ncbi:unnamed protein product [Meloidogyne enterolobii]|uniref:Uncharacterized protein n=1 Tax=Meloidogyne enterolobii TaxID=390850 RepID=A0ACB1AII6_MELEN
MLGLLSTALHGPEVFCMELLTSGGFYSFYFLKLNYLNNFFYFYVFFACGGVSQHGCSSWSGWDGGQLAIGGGQYATGGGQYANGGGQYAIGGGQYAIGGGQYAMLVVNMLLDGFGGGWLVLKFLKIFKINKIKFFII